MRIDESRIVWTGLSTSFTSWLDTESKRVNGKRQVIFTGCWVARMRGVVRLYRGAEHTRAGGGTAALRQRGEGAARGAPHCCILRAPIFGRLRWKTWHLSPLPPRAPASPPFAQPAPPPTPEHSAVTYRAHLLHKLIISMQSLPLKSYLLNYYVVIFEVINYVSQLPQLHLRRKYKRSCVTSIH